MFLTFSNTALLIGLAGAVIPLVLHLLSRTRYQTVDWGAMVFLQGLQGRQQYSARLNQILLLAARMTMVGLIAGMAGALAATRVFSSILFGVTATNVPTFAGIAALMLAIAVLASWKPARAATRVDPIEPLRAD